MAEKTIPHNEGEESHCLTASPLSLNAAELCVPRTEEEICRLIHELQGKKITLELQNAELCQVRRAVEAALETYTDLYDFAPVGYVTLDREGNVTAVNLTAAALVGVERSRLLGCSFRRLVSEETCRLFSAFLDKVFLNRGKESCEFSLERTGGDPLCVHIEAVVARAGRECRLALVDLSARTRVEESLRVRGEVNHTIVQSLSSHIAVIDRCGRIIAVNRAWMTFANNNNAADSSEVAVGANYIDICRRAGTNNEFDAAHTIAGIEAVQNGTLGQYTLEYPCHSPQQKQWFFMTVVPFGLGGEGGALITHHDITARKETEEALKNSEERYRRLFEMESDAVLMHYWETGQIIDVNGAALRMYGFTKEEFMYMRHVDISAEPSFTEKSIRNNETLIPFRLHRKKNGMVFPVEISVSYFNYLGRQVHVAVIRDITERMKSEETLTDLNKKLRALGEHLQKVQEGERLAMARDIHDEIGQNITVLKLDLEWIERRIPVDCRDLHERVNEMRMSVEQLTMSVQRIAADLRPPLLDSMGLSAAVEWYVAEFSKRSGLECYVMLNEDVDPLDQNTATAVMRIVQEGFTNIVRHARATEVSVSLCKRDRNLILEISDNGCGISHEQIDSSEAYGIMGMLERTRICRGKMEIYGKPGCGTILHLTVPLDTGEITE